MHANEITVLYFSLYSLTYFQNSKAVIESGWAAAHRLDMLAQVSDAITKYTTPKAL